MELNLHIASIENHLNLLLEELILLRTQGASERENWQEALEGFRVKATMIRRILDRFHTADLPTRRYLRQHLDEEFAQLQTTYDSLRDQFTAKDHKGDENGSGSMDSSHADRRDPRHVLELSLEHDG